jgi:hypothetical protein
MPRADWPKLLDPISPCRHHRHLPPRHKQGTILQCTADAVTTAMEFIRSRQGLPYVALSAADLYDRTRRSDGTSSLGDALPEAMANGVGTVEVSGARWRPGMTPSPEELRMKYRIGDVRYLPTFDEAFAASISGQPVMFSMTWRSGYRTDADGWLTRPTGTKAGHTLFSYKPAMRMTANGPEYGLWIMNSLAWSLETDGCAVVPESELRGVTYFSARTMTHTE